ncbi:hypothetical protein CEXT_766721 [Caerostris extrusa]|uniref:Uncharacterized protein n=1 Tax=Caerostris extrusa TaxID=172846 RepID=A0AAV4UIC0_CAEEX|nr:hypothetical protein CEXT_766721 [Caerostris extrusa]
MLWLNGPFFNLASLFKCDPDSIESHPLLKEIASKPRASRKDIQFMRETLYQRTVPSCKRSSGRSSLFFNDLHPSGRGRTGEGLKEDGGGKRRKCSSPSFYVLPRGQFSRYRPFIFNFG